MFLRVLYYIFFYHLAFCGYLLKFLKIIIELFFLILVILWVESLLFYFVKGWRSTPSHEKIFKTRRCHSNVAPSLLILTVTKVKNRSKMYNEKPKIN